MKSARSLKLAAVSVMAGVFIISLAESFLWPRAYPWFFREQVIPDILFLLAYFTTAVWARLFNQSNPVVLFYCLTILLLYIHLTAGEKRFIYKAVAFSALFLVLMCATALENGLTASYSIIILFLVTAATIPWSRKKRPCWKKRAREVITKSFVMYVKACLLVGWWALAFFSPAWALAPFALYLIFHFAGAGDNRPRRAAAKYGFIASGAFAGVLVLALSAVDNLQATRIDATRVFDYPAFDAVMHDDSILIATERKDNFIYNRQKTVRAVARINGRWLPIPYTEHPERLIYDPVDRLTYIANFWAGSKHPGLAVFDGRNTRPVSLDGCVSAIDLQAAEKRRELVVLCEESHTLHFVDMTARKETGSLTLPASMTYSLGLDEIRGRVYAANLGLGKLTAVDLETRRIAAVKRAPSWNTNMAVDPATGFLWISTPVSRSVAVLDSNLDLIDRIPVGLAPRDIAIDEKRDLVVVGNYVSGAVSVISRKSRKKLTSICVDRLPFVHMLSGIYIDSKGELIISKNDGVWETVDFAGLIASRIGREPNKKETLSATQ